MSRKSTLTEALVIKRSNVGEADRVVTLYTEAQGKIVAVAKGVRKMSSSKRAYIEPGNMVKVLLIETKSLPILTQATLLSDCSEIRQSLPRIRQLTQFLEIIDKLFVEQQEEEALFKEVKVIRNALVNSQPSAAWVREKLHNLISQLGYHDPNQEQYKSILQYVSVITDQPMKSWEYLKV